MRMMKVPDDLPRKELQEKDFIQDRLRKNPFPFWIWLVILTTFIAILWGTGNWYSNFINTEISRNPFLQVTNRQFSLFLWQFPEYMRINSKNKQGYLTGFQYEERITLVLKEADNYVVAPPSLIFLYHVWQRLISEEFISRPMPADEFKQFLAYAEEWQPRFWPNAPKPYLNFVADLEKSASNEALSKKEEEVIPFEVKQAFQGWKNYFKEGDAINAISPTYAEMSQFLKTNPNYARNYWQNIVYDNYPMYLKNIEDEHKNKEEIPKDELAPFLRVAFFNYSKSLPPE
jgi:hypothetical protein